MSSKLVLILFGAIIGFGLLACSADARHMSKQRHHQEDHYDGSPEAGRHPHPRESQRALSHKQARVFPGAVALKKLVLLKFKKVVPISLILLRSSNVNEAELVPVYPSSEIPSDVEFIPTPNGISGHKDVQAIAVPSEIHDQLAADGLDSIQNLLSQVEENEEDSDNKIAVEDTFLNVPQNDENPLLNLTPDKLSLRRLAADEIAASPALRGHTTLEEIPLFLYSAKDKPQTVQHFRNTKQQRRFRQHN